MSGKRSKYRGNVEVAKDEATKICVLGAGGDGVGPG